MGALPFPLYWTATAQHVKHINAILPNDVYGDVTNAWCITKLEYFDLRDFIFTIIIYLFVNTKKWGLCCFVLFVD